MKSFPNGACGDTALLLGGFLVDLGHSGFDYICGERGTQADNTWTSHAWLQRGHLFVDITADQFEDAPGSVIVELNSTWHQSFEVTRAPENGDFRAWSGVGTHHLHAMYAMFRSSMLK
jgi:hypothetical protein